MHNFLILFPVTTYILLILAFAKQVDVRSFSESFVKSHLVVFAFIAVSTELLSFSQSIDYHNLITVWFLFLLVCLVVTSFLVYRRRLYRSFPIWPETSFLTKLLVGFLLFVGSVTFITAILYPPNTWDSMTYHMTRVVHWINNNDVSFYTTANARQNYQMPLAEFAIMHIQILTNSDLYANLVQWVSFLVLICLGHLTAAELGLDKRQQLLTAVVVATLPMAILQASSTQNDLVASSFIMAFGLYMLRLQKNPGIFVFFWVALALGLALLTKGTAYLYCAAIGPILAIPIFLRCKADLHCLLKRFSGFSCVIIIAVLINAGHLSRNYNLYGHPLSTEGKHYQNVEMTASALVANLVKNGALHLGTPLLSINNYMENCIKLLFGEQLNSKKTTWAGTSFQIQFSLHEDTAGNFLHFLVVLLSIIVMPFLWIRGYYRRAIWYGISLASAILLYCWMLKWQPWAGRLHTPLFVMASPLLVVSITAGSSRIRKRFSNFVVFCMVFVSLFFVCRNSTRSLVSLNWLHDARSSCCV